MALKELIEQEEAEKVRFEARMHGFEVDGGAEGSGVYTPDDDLHYDPTQGQGNSAWQEARRMALEVNANRRRN